MIDYVLPPAYALFLWWFGTLAVLVLAGRPRRTHRWTLLAATLALPAAFYGLHVSREATDVAGAYVAFTSAVLVWAWQEIAFLLGFVTGPRRTPCPAGLAGWPRAASAFRTISHHELALLILGAIVAALTWEGPNRLGLWTFAVLWVMRQSAKLNLFLGVRNLSEAFLPAHLGYLASYFARRPMNPLLPVSVAGTVVALALVGRAAAQAGAGSGEATGLSLLATLLAAALIEHLFMVTPMPADALWRWGLGSRGAAAPDKSSGLP